MVRNNMIKNCPITDSYNTNNLITFGPNLDGTRGKTVQQNKNRLVTEYVAVPM